MFYVATQRFSKEKPRLAEPTERRQHALRAAQDFEEMAMVPA